jgi:hypothetical protein
MDCIGTLAFKVEQQAKRKAGTATLPEQSVAGSLHRLRRWHRSQSDTLKFQHWKAGTLTVWIFTTCPLFLSDTLLRPHGKPGSLMPDGIQASKGEQAWQL